MTASTLTREQLRQRINHLEALDCLLVAIDDVSGVEFDAGEPQTLSLQISDSGKIPVSFVHELPPDVLLAGLQAMRERLEARSA